MDQSAFRSFLGGQASSTSSTLRPRPATSGAVGGSKHRLGIGARDSRRDHGIGETIPPSGSVEQFRPRQQKLAVDKGKAKAVDEDKPAEPSYTRYGYADRASMRRAGLEEKAAAVSQDERRPRGLDFSKLDPDKRALLGIEAEELPTEDEPDEPLPLKTDEEIERELAEAELGLKVEDHHPAKQPDQNNDNLSMAPESLPKKQKRSRAEMLRDLQARIASSSSVAVTEVKEVVPTVNQGRKKLQKTADSGPVVTKGFRPIERAPEKVKKKRKQPTEAAIPLADPEEQDLATGSSQYSLATKGASTGASLEDADDDDDIFGGAGDYDDGLSADEAPAEEGEVISAAQTEQSGPVKYFEDQDEIIPKFETWRSPTPPPRDSTGALKSRDAKAYEDGNAQSSQRLEGFSTSQFTARDLLDRDNALEKEERRKLKKLKGKDKKEAMERMSELDGSLTAEQKEKNRLNRDAQQYENYEKKKQKRERPEA